MCKPDKRGRCQDHGILMKTQTISSKIWGERGAGQGYGWLYKKVKKYVCQAAVEALKTPLAVNNESPSSCNEVGLNDMFGVFQHKGATTTLCEDNTTTTQCEDRITRYTCEKNIGD